MEQVTPRASDQTRDLYLQSALLAGEILIRSNAEAYRVEDTVQHILSASDFVTGNVVAQTTSFYLSVEEPDGPPTTYIRRIEDRSLNLHRINRVNNISRCITKKTITIEEAYEKLASLKDSEYSTAQKNLAIFFFINLMLLLLKGTMTDLLVNQPISAIIVLILHFGRRFSTPNLLFNYLCCATAAMLANLATIALPFAVQTDILIISCIVPMIPGISLTNAIRDIFRGDYASGLAKLLESILIAVFIALGTASGLLLVRGVIGWSI